MSTLPIINAPENIFEYIHERSPVLAVVVQQSIAKLYHSLEGDGNNYGMMLMENDDFAIELNLHGPHFLYLICEGIDAEHSDIAAMLHIDFVNELVTELTTSQPADTVH